MTSGFSLLEDLEAKTKDMKKDEFLKYVVKKLNEINHYNWVGIYVIKGNELVLKTFSGPRETEHKIIPLGKGICGLAAEVGKTVIVQDVSKDTRYISCFSSTKSEIVVPIIKNGKTIGEIDIDSDYLNAFTESDKNLLEEVAKIIERKIEE
ncbi:MAG: GAF domain-containing protein [Thermoproteota archaeon]|nr:GAF domain-containing protein [Candidatus Brockarchaeota archaeon]MBO3768755.1 GAF domain-containing protein [Candidatus Brockarchaeota archaeon]MBO3800844.1 GAF domain-containing protein [Candidatus Brockarchaeota archaeon]